MENRIYRMEDTGEWNMDEALTASIPEGSMLLKMNGTKDAAYYYLTQGEERYIGKMAWGSQKMERLADRSSATYWLHPPVPLHISRG